MNQKIQDPGKIFQPRNHNFFFSRITDFVNNVYKDQDKLIENKDISTYSCTYLQAQYIVDQMNKKVDPSQKINLIQLIYKLNWKIFNIGLLFNLGQQLCGCAGIYFLDKITNQLKQTTLDDESKIWFVVLIILLFLCFLIKTLLFSQVRWLRVNHTSMLQAQLRYLILQKSLRLQCYCDSRDHQNKVDMTQLMTADSREAAFIYFGAMENITSVVTLSVILYFIYTKLGAMPTFYGCIVLVLSIILNSSLHNLINKQYKTKLSMGDERISLTKDVVEGIKSIKYLGWEDIFLNKISQAREKEFKYINRYTFLNIIATVLWITLGYLLLYVFLIVYSLEGNDILKQNIFTVLALFAYIKQPLGNIPYAVSFFLRSLVSFERIGTFLDQKEISNLGYKRGIQQVDSINSIELSNSLFYWPRLAPSLKQRKDKIKGSQAKSLTQESDSRTISKDIFSLRVSSLSIQQGSLNIIIGEIGSGKTAFLLSILNELEHKQIDISKEKKIQINGSIGYVSQNHWLQSQTIKENIVFGEQFDKSWYNQCITACELDEDFTQFAEADEKVVGPGGSNLSGGQRQRIALCRAIYQKKNIYLLDDVFSSLDAHVAIRIYNQVVITLLTQYLKATVLLVTSHYKIIDFNYTNINVIYINNGLLYTDKETVQEYLNSANQSDHSASSDDNQEEDSISKSENNIQSSKQEHAVKVSKESSKEINIEKSAIVSDQDSKTQSQKEEKTNNKDKNNEEREKGTINKNTLLLFFESRGFIFTVLHILFSFLIQGSQMLTDFWLRDYSKDNLNQSHIQTLFQELFGDFNQIFKYLTITNLVIALLCGLLNAFSSIKSCRSIFDRLNRSIIFSKMTFFDRNPIGRIISRVSSDQIKVDESLQQHYHVMLEKISYLLGYPIGMIIQFPWTIVHFSFIMFLAFLVSKRFRVSSRQLTRLNQINQGSVLTVISENIQGLSLIRSMSKQSFILEKFVLQMEDCITSQTVLDAVNVWFVVRLFILSNSSFILIVFSNIYMIVSGSEITGNTVALGLIYSMLFSTVFADFLGFFNLFEQDIISLERIEIYLRNLQENLLEGDKNINKEDNLKRKMLNSDEESQLSLNNLSLYKQDQCISFRNIYLSYTKKDQVSDKYALKNVSFDIKKGEKIAFCGRTGSGKTSILNALFRLYDINSGEIIINQQNSAHLSLSELRKEISIIPQYGFLFNSSMQNNLDPSNKISRKEMSRVLNKFDSLQIINQNNSIVSSITTEKRLPHTNIKNQQQELTTIESENNIFISSDKNKISSQQNVEDNSILDMQIQESGKNLSNGEKQIINFFRIVLRESEILCLDEATSNMDPKTDKILHEELFKFSEDKTLIVITHRLENIEMYDRVFVMDQGEIVESGHVSQLKNNPNGFFNRLIQNNQL